MPSDGNLQVEQPRFYRTCEYCKVVGHAAKACPVLQRKALEKVSKEKAETGHCSSAE